jgi:hypothetical protein
MGVVALPQGVGWRKFILALLQKRFWVTGLQQAVIQQKNPHKYFVAFLLLACITPILGKTFLDLGNAYLKI